MILATEYRFDLHRIILGDHPAVFYAEIALRTSVMFLFALVLLRFMGKRSIGQLSPFDLVIIIALGSAVGDPMFYADVPLADAMVVVAVVVGLESVIARVSQRNAGVARFIDSAPTVLIMRGRVDQAALRREVLSRDELFELLRLEGIESVDEIEVAVLEPSGRLSVLRRGGEVTGGDVWADVLVPGSRR